MCGITGFISKDKTESAGAREASFGADALEANIKAFADAVIKAKPAGAKGNYVKKIAISSTQGKGVKVDPATVSA